MKVTVRPIGGFIQKLGYSEKTLELPERATAADLATSLGLGGIPHMVTREGVVLHAHDPLADGDRLLVSALFSGG